MEEDETLRLGAGDNPAWDEAVSGVDLPDSTGLKWPVVVDQVFLLVLM